MLAAINIDWVRATYLAVLLIVVAGSYMISSSNRFRDLRAIAVWTGITAVLVLVYAFREEGKFVWERVAATVVPGYVISEHGEMVVVRSEDGMFDISGKVNGSNVDFIFDTGASAVTLTAEDAEAAGIHLADSDFTAHVQTANGEAQAAEITVDLLQVGAVSERNVKAMVAKPGALDQSLLGHSFLDRLTSYEVKGDRLTLRYK